MKRNYVVLIAVFLFIFGIVPIFSQEGRFMIIGDDINSQLRWIDLHTGDQYFSLTGITVTGGGITLVNNNNYIVTVVYRIISNGRIGTATLQPRGTEGSTFYTDNPVTLLSQMPK